jgi:archaellum component FlaC
VRVKIDSPPAIAPQSTQPQHREQKPHRQERKQIPGREIPQRHNEGLRAKVERPDKRAQQDQRRGSDISDLLRQIDSHFQGLRNELQTVRNQLKQSSPQSRQIESAPAGISKEIAKLREENSQLAETVRQLRETLSELATEDFEEAVSRKADTDSPVTDPLEQYKSLITLRLREQIVNFQELNPDKHVDGLPLLLDNILRTLLENGVDLTNIETPPTTAKRRY